MAESLRLVGVCTRRHPTGIKKRRWDCMHGVVARRHVVAVPCSTTRSKQGERAVHEEGTNGGWSTVNPRGAPHSTVAQSYNHGLMIQTIMVETNIKKEEPSGVAGGAVLRTRYLRAGMSHVISGAD